MNARFLRIFLVLLLPACGRVATSLEDAVDAPDGGASRSDAAAGGGVSGSRAFDPGGYSTACASTSDCMMAPVIQNCVTCCRYFPVNAAAVSAELAAVERLCATTTGRGYCGMGCERARAECFEGQCIECKERTCLEGVLVHAPITAPGTYALEAVIDGATLGCTIKLPSRTTDRTP